MKGRRYKYAPGQSLAFVQFSMRSIGDDGEIELMGLTGSGALYVRHSSTGMWLRLEAFEEKRIDVCGELAAEADEDGEPYWCGLAPDHDGPHVDRDHQWDATTGWTSARSSTTATSACATTTCSEAATDTVFWPGQTRNMCRPCATRAEQIGDAMGCPIAVRPIENTPKGGG
jgi:hypothetical protein